MTDIRAESLPTFGIAVRFQAMALDASEPSAQPNKNLKQRGRLRYAQVASRNLSWRYGDIRRERRQCQ
jgi:hypothetical protein